ncbi:MAG TPA: BatD family protein [Candidatus Eisenbacteria bacterium]|nr:BatD family protein [Candidatus Eisenbacteria bacterium]
MTGRRLALLAATWVLCSVLPAAHASAQNVRVEAELDREEIGLHESAILTVTVTAAGTQAHRPRVPDIPGLRVDPFGESQGFSWVNGRVSRTVTSMYRLRPQRTGDFTIPPIQAGAEGRPSPQARPLVLRVRNEPPARRGGSDDLFVRLQVDRTRVYWNQAVTARFKLYSRTRVEAPTWDPPSASGFWAEVLGPARAGREVVGGLEYDTFELHVVYFPTRTGRLQIGPGRIHAQVVRRVPQPDPWSSLGMPETQVEEVELVTAPVLVQVMPLPGGAPEGFRGAVGDFELDVRLDRVTTRAGEPVTVTSILRGSGNLASATDPDVLAQGAARRHTSPGTTSFDRSGNRLRGERRRDTTFIPETPGELRILPVRFSWFDPETERYRTQTADTIRVRVSPGGSTADSLALARPSAPLAAARSRPGARGRLDLAPPAGARALALTSLVAAIGAFAARRVRDRSARDPRRRRVAAIDTRLGELRAARAAGAARAAAVASNAILESAAIRHGANVEGLPLLDTLEALARAGATEGELSRLKAIHESLDRLAFAPDSKAEGAAHTAALEEAERAILRYREEAS